MITLVDAGPQSAEHYRSANTRTLYGISNFWNVTTNVLFLVFGFAGLILLGVNARLTIMNCLKSVCYILFLAFS